MKIKAQKKPIIVEAIEYTGDNKKEIIDFTIRDIEKKKEKEKQDIKEVLI